MRLICVGCNCDVYARALYLTHAPVRRYMANENLLWRTLHASHAVISACQLLSAPRKVSLFSEELRQ